MVNVPPDVPNGSHGASGRQDDATEHAIATSQSAPPAEVLTTSSSLSRHPWRLSPTALVLSAIALMILGLAFHNVWLGVLSAFVTFAISVIMIWPNWRRIWRLIPSPWSSLIIAAIGILSALVGLLILSSANDPEGPVIFQINWDAVGAVGEISGALGQILIAILAVYIAWQQYVISRDLTIEQNRLTTQQNILTQQQTIDAYFQGISDLALDDEGLLEDWPQERAFSEGRTAAILSSVDAAGKAKVLRFLSQSRLLTPLRRDRHLGRPILDGDGGYQEDREFGVRVIDLGVMLAGADLSGTDLRWTELSDANLIRANLTRCDLVKANLARTILYEAKLTGADLKNVRFFYGATETATPRTRSEYPDYKTGVNTGAVVENADFTEVQRLSEEQRYYCCAWGGSRTRETIPGGCEGIPNKLGR